VSVGTSYCNIGVVVWEKMAFKSHVALQLLLLLVVRTNGQDDLHAIFTASCLLSRPICYSLGQNGN
jgi:hypothetical protein